MDKSVKTKYELNLNEGLINTKIHIIRGLHVILDEDLAVFYQAKTKRLNEQVKRNIERFPLGFMFQLTKEEYSHLKSQIATTNPDWGGRRALPYAFTEHGVAMLSGVLKSDVAVKISIIIIKSFVSMRRFLASNAQIFNRLDYIDKKHVEYDEKFEQVFNAIETKELKPEKGIFFEGQIFDAYEFVSKLIKSAQKSIVLIDNYVDETTLTLFGKRGKNVDAMIYTKEISKQLSLDLAKYNSQYHSIEIKEFRYSHDRFLMIDGKELYHFGASLKDLGKKWFAFSKLNEDITKVLEKLR